MSKQRLDNFFLLKRGHDLPSQDRKEGTSPVISSSGITGYHSKAKAKGPGVVTGRCGTLGEVFYEKRNFWPLNTTLYVYDFKGSNPKFVYYYLKALNFDHLSSAAAVPGLDRNVLHSLKVEFPALPIQQKVAAILSAYDELIDNNNQRISLLEQMAEEIYKEWFVRLRFPGHEQTRIVDGVPDGWEKAIVASFGKVVTGKTPSKAIPENFDGDIPFIKTPDMGQGIFAITTGETLSQQGADAQKGQYIPKNSICVSCIGTAGEICITVSKSQTNQQINSIVLDEDIFREYVYFSMKSMKPMIELFGATGATMTNLSKGKFTSLHLFKPDNRVCTKFHKLAGKIFDEIVVLSEKNKILKQTRDLLLPRLMSGKLSVEHLLTSDL